MIALPDKSPMTSKQRYKRSAKGRAAQRRYEQTSKGKATRKRYNSSPKGRASDLKYRATEYGHLLRYFNDRSPQRRLHKKLQSQERQLGNTRDYL